MNPINDDGENKIVDLRGTEVNSYDKDCFVR